MKKKIGIVLLALISSACCAAALAACSDNSPGGPGPGNHKASHQMTWIKGEDDHYQKCNECNYTSPTMQHTFNDGVCQCGQLHVIYELNPDGQSYYVKGTRTAFPKPTHVTILAEY